VQPEDLEKVGMGKPGVRRLLEAVKKRKTQHWRRNILTKLIPAAGGKTVTSSRGIQNMCLSLTCLIQEKDVRSVWKVNELRGAFRSW
jgi:activated CDC42 kinase 1